MDKTNSIGQVHSHSTDLPNQEGLLEQRTISRLHLGANITGVLSTAILICGIASFFVCGPLSLVIPLSPLILFVGSIPIIFLGMGIARIAIGLQEEADQLAYRNQKRQRLAVQTTVATASQLLVPSAPPISSTSDDWNTPPKSEPPAQLSTDLPPPYTLSEAPIASQQTPENRS